MWVPRLQLLSLALLLLCVSLPAACGPDAMGTRQLQSLSGEGWQLWLDESADWADELPRLPDVDPASLPVHAPSGGWHVPGRDGRSVQVPGTVEGYTWPERGDYVGVSWWSRSIQMPASAAGRVARLRFDAVRLAAEIYLDGRLVGYDAVGGTPFVVPLGDAAIPGATQRLDVRIVDPGGNFDWIDHSAQRWGQQTIPASHGFGGILGDVWLELVDPLHVDDIFVRNSAEPRTLELQIKLAGARDYRGPVQLELLRWGGDVLHAQAIPAPPDGWEHGAQLRVSVPAAQLWSPEQPSLYEARVSLPDGDALSVRFGFRWFAPEGQGDEALFRLNGRRVVLRSAISWGFWPVTGAVPTRELAAAQVRSAKDLGLNTLNHHRNMAHPYALDASDELGLLAHLEPGGYWAQGGDARCRALAREKWLRMVHANRNRPSVVIHNMINEASEPPWEGALEDLLAARAIDPSRTLTYTSAWADDDDPALSLHARPLPSGRDEQGAGREALVTRGWHDQHRAPGPGCWRDSFYNGPDDYRLRSERRDTLLLRGEEAAIAGPPRLAAMSGSYDAAGGDGWDGGAYRAWAAGWSADLSAMGLLQRLGGLDAVTRSAAMPAHNLHARSIALARAADVLDGYVINGWECEPLENHSGIVDIWRRPKAEPSPLSAANAPALVVITPHQHVLHGARRRGGGVRAPAIAKLDLWVVNELDLHGPHELTLRATDVSGRELFARSWPVSLTGGERFGELLVADVTLQLDLIEGRVELLAELHPAGPGAAVGPRRADAEPLARGVDRLQLVDWLGPSLRSDGALLGSAPVIESFIKNAKRVDMRAYDPAAPAPAWVLVAGSDPEPAFQPGARAAAATGAAAGAGSESSAGLRFPGIETWELRTGEGAWIRGRAELASSLIWGEPSLPSRPDGAPAQPAEAWEQRWSGTLLPQQTGPYRFHVRASLGARLQIDGQLVLDSEHDRGPRRMTSRSIELTAGQPVPFSFSVRQEQHAAAYALSVTPPAASAPFRRLAAKLLRQVEQDGTTLVVLDHTAAWARLLSDLGALDYQGEFSVGRYWMGGGYLAAPHPLLSGLPAEGALGWPWQELVASDRRHSGLHLGETVRDAADSATGGSDAHGRGGPGDGGASTVQTVIAVWSDHQPRLASALAELRWGRGRIILSTLDLMAGLDAPPGAVSVPRRLLCNLLNAR